MRISRAALFSLVSLVGCHARACDRSKAIVGDDASATPPIDLVEACIEGARARCLATDRCEPGSALYWGGIDRCAEQSRRWCRAMVVAPGAALTVDAIRACADAFARSSCDELANDVEACTFRGALALGAACAFPPQCVSGVCGFDRDKSCGRCVEGRLKKIGEACVVAGYECDRGMTCIDGACAPLRRVGEACEVLDCERKLQCVGGKCAPYAKVGDACGGLSGVDCAPQGKCVGGVCVARESPKPPGERCDDLLDCIDFACVRGTCVTLGELGAACSHDAEVAPPCANGFVCAKGKCVALDAFACK